METQNPTHVYTTPKCPRTRQNGEITSERAIRQSLQHTPPLTKEECFRLSRLSKQGDKGATDTLVLSVSRLAYNLAKKLSHYKGTFEDRYQTAMLGASVAASKYDEKFDTKFSTYALWWMRSCIQRYLQYNAPFRLTEANSSYLAIIAAHYASTDTPSHLHIAKKCQISTKLALHLCMLHEQLKFVAPCDDAADHRDPIDHIANENAEIVNTTLESLDERQAYILRERANRVTILDIAKTLNITKQRAAQLEKRGMLYLAQKLGVPKPMMSIADAQRLSEHKLVALKEWQPIKKWKRRKQDRVNVDPDAV